MERKLYVTNIPLHWNKEDVTQLFVRFGEVVSVSLIVNADGTSKGFAFVRMSGDEAAIAAITELNESEIEGHKIGVWHKPPKNGWESPRERRKVEVEA